MLVGNEGHEVVPLALKEAGVLDEQPLIIRRPLVVVVPRHTLQTPRGGNIHRSTGAGHNVD